MTRFVKAVVVALALVLGLTASAPAYASVITWQLVGVTFDDGGFASGTFSTDSSTGNLLSYNLVTTTGSVRSGYVYDGVGDSKFADNYFVPNSFLILNDVPFAFPLLNLTFANPLTSFGTDFLVLSIVGQTSGSFEANNDSSEWRVVTGGYATAVPEPGTFAMLLAGLGLLGFTTRRRRQTRGARI